MRKYFYAVPVKVFSSENPQLRFTLEIKTPAKDRRQAIAIAKKKAEKYFLYRFSTYSLDKTHIKVEKDKIEVKGSKEVKERKKKRKQNRSPLLPFCQKIRYLPDEIYKVGDEVIHHKVIIFDDWLKMKLLKEEKPFLRQDTLIIKGPEYVKVLTKNREDMPIFLRFDYDKKKNKIDSMVEFIQGFGYCSWVPKDLFLFSLNIARELLRKKEVEKDAKSKV